MARALVTVVVVLVVVLYLALFVSWNGEPVHMSGLQFGKTDLYLDLPVSYLLLIGVILGALAMAAALWAPWKTLKASEAQNHELIERAKKKLKSQDQKVKDLTAKLEDLEAQAAPSAQEMDLAPQVDAPAQQTDEAGSGQEGGGESGPDGSDGESPAGDPEVI